MDPIADMIIKIKNAGRAGKESVVIPHSKVKAAILETLASAGFVGQLSKKGKKSARNFIEATLVYEENSQGVSVPKIAEVKRMSKPSARLYVKAKDIRPVRSGYGVMILSTPKGIMTGEQAKKEKLGGEILFTAW